MRPMIGLVAAALAGCSSSPTGHLHPGPLYVPPALPACTPAAGAERVVCPAEATGFVANPHLGIESFYALREDHPDDAWQQPTVAYYRIWWNELEPSRGALRFDVLDDLFARARAQGQTVALRVMPEESVDDAQRVPAWLADAAGGTWGSRGGEEYFSPDYDAPAYLDAVRATAQALADRYADAGLESVDVGFVGDAGEWAYANDDAHLPSPASARALIDTVVDAFPHTPVLMNLGSVDDGAAPVAYAISRGAGWRADCWGDILEGWNHHDAFYESQLTAAGAGEVWRHAPVALETCGDLPIWEEVGFEVDQVRWALHWALEKHASRVNLKSKGVPEAYRASVEEFLSSVGYRLVVAEVRAARVEDSVRLRVRLANRGVAPFYRPLRLAVRAGLRATFSTALDALTEIAELELTVPIAPGTPIDLALVTPSGDVAARLANAATAGDGWLRVLATAP